MPTLLKAKEIKDKELPKLNELYSQFTEETGRPKVTVVLVGNNPASKAYVGHKEKFFANLNADFELVKLEESVSKEDFLKKVEQINTDPNIHGLLVQLPLPKQLQDIDTSTLVAAEKDIDGFHPLNQFGVLQVGEKHDGPIPCTPRGCLKILDHYNIDVAGKNVVVVGRSMIVGKPVANLLTARNATVTLCHSRTKDLKTHTKTADVIILAVGKPRFFDSSYLDGNKPVLIDVGISRDDEDKLCGDANFDEIADHCLSITPVPGGVGPMTVFCLAENLLDCYKTQKG
jgi:methylenetetrahydrofolate dehydrogenase (NADP+)/methenyltetrahydrofolate cyclohydrolase